MFINLHPQPVRARIEKYRGPIPGEATVVRHREGAGSILIRIQGRQRIVRVDADDHKPLPSFLPLV